MKQMIREIVKANMTVGLVNELHTNTWIIDEIGDRTGLGYRLNGEFSVLYKHICGKVGHAPFADFAFFIHSPHSRGESIVNSVLEAIKANPSYNQLLREVANDR